MWSQVLVHINFESYAWVIVYRLWWPISRMNGCERLLRFYNRCKVRNSVNVTLLKRYTSFLNWPKAFSIWNVEIDHELITVDSACHAKRTQTFESSHSQVFMVFLFLYCAVYIWTWELNRHEYWFSWAFILGHMIFIRGIWLTKAWTWQSHVPWLQGN